MFFLRRWAVDVMMTSLSAYTKQLRGTIYLPWWYRLMGASIGRHAEVSSYVNVSADKLTLGDHVFLADDVVVGMPHVEAGLVTHERVTVRARSFVGNASVVRTGTFIPEEMLVGVQSLAPKAGAPRSTYLGSLPIQIKREGDGKAALPAAGEALTYNPPAHLILARCVVEGVGYLVLQFCLALCFALLYICVAVSYVHVIDHLYALLLPVMIIAHSALAGLLTVALKWVIIGRFKPGVYPLYGTYVWRTELVERLEENLAIRNLFSLISGTIWMQRFFEGMGVTMGKRCYLDHACFCEPDLVTVGDYINIERTGTLQAHLFQDRVRTTGPIKIGECFLLLRVPTLRWH
jgi:non-ribosomal peptide synthetase-like protein